MNDPVQALIDDHINLSIVHHHFRDQLEQFQVQTTSENLNLLIDIIDYLKHYPECHHHALEDKIYRLMRLRIEDQSLRAFIDEIELQHHHMKLLADRIDVGLSSIANDMAVNKDIITTDCQRYLTLYEEHIHNENLYLLPNIEVYLTEQELCALYEEVEAEQDPLFGPQRQEAYNNLFNHITNALLSA